MKDLLKQMEDVTKEIETLEAKRSDEKDADKAKILDEEIVSKTGDWNKLEAKVKQMKAKEEREKLIASMREDRDEVESNAKTLTRVDVPKSKHNEDKDTIERDKVCRAYMIGGKEDLIDAAKGNDNMIEAVRDPHKEGKGFLLPSYVRDHILTNRFVSRAKTEYTVLTSDASGSQSGGGSLVPYTFVPELYKIPQTLDRIMDKCYVKRAIGGTAQFPKLTQSSSEPFGVTATWDDEGGSMTESDPVFSQLTLGTNRLTCLSYVSEKELRVNAIGLEAEMATMFRNTVDRKMSIAILSGNGSGKPQGINSELSMTAGVNRVARETANQVSYADLVALQMAVDEGVSGDGMFVFGKGGSSAFAYISKLDDSDGRPVLRDWNTWVNGMNTIPAIAGSEWVATPANAVSLGGRGDVMFGAFRNYAIAVDLDVTVARSDEYLFNKGVVTFRVMFYAGGKPLGATCFSVLDDVSGVSSSSSSSST